MSLQFDPNYPEFLADATRRMYEALLELGLSDEQADFAAREAVEVWRVTWGGQLVYVPKGISYRATKRDWDVWSKFRGNNAPELAREFNLSTRMVQYIVSRMRELDRARRQPDLLEPRPEA